MARKLLLVFVALAYSSVLADEPDIEEMSECEQIVDDPADHDDHLFNFHQHDERLDPNQFLRIVYQMMSLRKTEPVKKVTLEFNPILHHLVGPYSMRSTVEHVAPDGSLSDTCYDITVQIHDTNECTHEGASEWMHNCHESTSCVNTEGGYYCACPEGEWAVKDSGNGKCSGETDSTQCCGEVTYDGHPHGDVLCRADFMCHRDSCAFNDCDPNAACVEGAEPNTYTCQCNDWYRDVSATYGLEKGMSCQFVDHCEISDACPLGCECESVVDQNTDGYFCNAKPGFAKYLPLEEDEWASSAPKVRSEFQLDAEPPYICASQDPVEVELLGDKIMVLAQGERFVEPGVRITDDSVVDLKRRFTTDYSHAHALSQASSFAKTCGVYNITYELATPWIVGHAKATATRVVEVVDVDECSYAGEDPDFVNHCHFPARCVNVPCGTQGFNATGPSYQCVCDNPGWEPDDDFGCVRKEGDFEEDVPPEDYEPFYEKLHEAFLHMQWDTDRLHVDKLRKYKRMIQELMSVSHDKTDLPKDYAWDTPYRKKDAETLRLKCVERGLASPLGASELSTKALISLLAHDDHKKVTKDCLDQL